MNTVKIRMTLSRTFNIPLKVIFTTLMTWGCTTPFMYVDLYALFYPVVVLHRLCLNTLTHDGHVQGVFFLVIENPRCSNPLTDISEAVEFCLDLCIAHRKQFADVREIVWCNSDVFPSH